MQNPQAPSNTRVRCCGRSVKVTNLIVPLPSGGGAKGQTGWRNFAELAFHARQGEAPGLLDPDPPLDLGRLGSVPRYRRVHRGIGIEAAFEVHDLLEAGSPEGPGDVGAAVAVVADHDGLACGVEFRKTLLQPGHRDESRTLYAGDFELPRLAHIE